MVGKHAALHSDPSGVAPEHVLVIEVNGSVREFHETVAQTRGLEWLADEDLRDLEPDEDFHDPGALARSMAARLYLVLSNQEALSQLLSLYRLWSRGQPLGREHSAWSKLFRCIRQIRRWDVKDRLQEAGLLESWEERKRAGEEKVPVEIELWFRSDSRRTAAEDRIRELVQRLGGQVTHVSTIPAIAYHALCARLPIQAADGIAAGEEVDLVKSDDIFLFHPVPQALVPGLDEEPDVDGLPMRAVANLGEPVVALLDGLPMENHQYLAGRLVVDDPDGWSENYHAAARKHGTAMASLILHGDLSAGEEPLSRRLYVRSIMQPDYSSAINQWNERAPENILWVDLVHRAVRRMIDGDDGMDAVAPAVCICNLSIGDQHRPFVHRMSPMARLLDWLAWKYQVLFIVSAGNSRLDDFVLDETALTKQDVEIATLRQIHEQQRHLRLLSPAESINALTVGASHEDHAGPWQPRMDDERLLVSTPGLPSPFSALGRGFRRAVKPDFLMPGGRAVFRKDILRPTRFSLRSSPRLPPGQRVAAPSSTGDTRRTWFGIGTSNAAALTSRLAARIYDQLQDVLGDGAPKIPMALWIKALLVHAASWPLEAKQVLEQAIKDPVNRRSFRDEATAFLGYGTIDADRALGCTNDRVTLLGGGTIQDGETWIHHLPVPASLHTRTHWRRLTTTLAWFTPIHAGHRKYRSAALRLEVPQRRGSILGVEPVAAHGHAVLRGTVQHQIFERQGGAMNVAEDSTIALSVSCTAETGPLSAPIPYALAVTLEIAPDLLTAIQPIYEEIRNRLRQAIRIGTS